MQPFIKKLIVLAVLALSLPVSTPSFAQGHISHVADYLVIPGTDQGFELRANERRSFPFRLPAGALLNERAIIAFVVDPNSSADHLRYEVQINDHVLRTGSLTGGVSRALWETFGGDVLRDGEANSIEFRVLTGNGSFVAWAVPRLKFQDVVVWFQRKVAEAPTE